MPVEGLGCHLRGSRSDILAGLQASKTHPAISRLPESDGFRYEPLLRGSHFSVLSFSDVPGRGKVFLNKPGGATSDLTSSAGSKITGSFDDAASP